MVGWLIANSVCHIFAVAAAFNYILNGLIFCPTGRVLFFHVPFYNVERENSEVKYAQVRAILSVRHPQANYKILAARIQNDIYLLTMRLRHTTLRAEFEQTVSERGPRA